MVRNKNNKEDILVAKGYNDLNGFWCFYYRVTSVMPLKNHKMKYKTQLLQRMEEKKEIL